ncbi:MAG TPA: hypothetical protein VLC95_05410, partial [Anaerolineae bacterium]|nr:hypothetical protein [Anaerolineae bacterium]
TAHEPAGALASMATEVLPWLAGRYAALVAYCSRDTHPTLLDLLADHGVVVWRDPEGPGGIVGIGNVRRATVRAGLEAGTTHLQMCDFDRALHWAAHYPDELEEVIVDIARHDLLVLGRTPRAWATHPAYQRETEPLFNHTFALATGLEWDVGAGSRGLSRRAVEALLELSREQTVGVDAEWPLILLNRKCHAEANSTFTFRTGYRACEGLEFETADRFTAEIEAAGSYDAWLTEMEASPARWAFRLQVAHLIAQAVVDYGSPPTDRKW